jgi:hypothetical protein
MNWAWATGPTLAALFGGAVYGFTSDLHKARLSRRTAGILISAAGEKQARFIGGSELFFPAAGRYDVTVPNAEVMESGLNGSSNRNGNGIIARSLQTIDDGTSVSLPALSVPNMAFRRFSHAQPAAWGEGVTTDLELNHDGTVVTGTIHNGTGRTLNNAYIYLPTKQGIAGRRFVSLRQVMPGITKFSQKIRVSFVYNPPLLTFSGVPDERERGMKMIERAFLSRDGSTPVLEAKTSGENLGPTVGKYVGGPEAVTVAVTLPPIRSAGNTGVKGGPK